MNSFDVQGMFPHKNNIGMKKEKGEKMTRVTTQDMVIKYLEENGYDGLCGDECGCEIDDLMPCEQCYPFVPLHLLNS